MPFSQRFPRLHRVNTLLWVLAFGTVAVLMLPVVYLLIRGWDSRATLLEVLSRPSTLLTLGRTLGLALSVTLASTAIAVPLAWFTLRCDIPLRRLWIILTPMPLVIPSYIGAYLYASALGPYGLLQQYLKELLGIERLPSIYGFWGATLTLTLLSYPYALLAVRGTLLRLDPAQEEAARSLGSNAWNAFWRVTWPLLRPSLGVGGLLVALYALRDFGAVAIMRYDTFTSVIYNQFNSFNRSQASILALVLVALTLIFIFAEAKMQRKTDYFQNEGGGARKPQLIELGCWRWPASLFCGFIISAALLLPAAVLAYWLVRGLMAQEAISPLWELTWNSLKASGLAMLVTIIAALPIAILAVRQKNRLSLLFERLTYAAYALPGVVVALALIFFGINHAQWFYQTLGMLVLGYVILFLPQAVGTIRSTLLQIHPNLEDAARNLQGSPRQVICHITLPLLRPGLISGGILVFLSTMKELPATLLLSPVGYQTLATSVWSSVIEAYFAAAAAPALLIMLSSSLPLALLLFFEHRKLSK
jgi:iron(III) transport system permease protein